MSNLHLVSNLSYKKRIIQLGENQKYFRCGRVWVDLIKKTKLIQKKKLKKILISNLKKIY